MELQSEEHMGEKRDGSDGDAMEASGPPTRARHAGGGGPEAGPAGTKSPHRFSAQRKLSAVQRLFRGESLEAVSRDLNVPAWRLSEWRDRALAGAGSALKERDRDARDAENERLRAKVGEITMANELLHDKIARLEAGRPLARRRSRR
jgi:transposase